MAPLTPQQFKSYSIDHCHRGESITRILASAINSVDPYDSTRRHIRLEEKFLHIGKHTVDLDQLNDIYLVGAGKAGVPMAQALVDCIGDRITSGVIIVKEGHKVGWNPGSKSRVQILEASHPLPDQRGVKATAKLVAILDAVCERDLVIVVISGGGSALLLQPVSGVSLEDMRSMTGQLLATGATIQEINVLRKHLDAVKGGQLSRDTYPGRSFSLILSDVIGDPLDMIASGPTVPDPSTFIEALAILRKFKLEEKIPQTILRHLQKGTSNPALETPKPGDAIFNRVENILIGSNRQSCEAAKSAAEKEGFEAIVLTHEMIGEARITGHWFVEKGREILSKQVFHRPLCLIAGGETTVTLSGSGLGGRNQEFALATVALMKELSGSLLITLATDGGDGPTDAAGAVVTDNTWLRSLDMGLHPETYLANNDSYHYFQLLGDLIKTGPTQTNFNDLAFLFVF